MEIFDIFIKAMKDEPLRLTNGDSWLVWFHGRWTVFQRKAYQKKNRVLIERDKFEDALDCLIKGRKE